MDREKIVKWIKDSENPSGPDRWVDPWTWAKEMKEVLAELDRLTDELQSPQARNDNEALHRFLRGELI
jgi:hypothetical protein